jgi:imidazolonepropionase-like amidohydrolase
MTPTDKVLERIRPFRVAETSAAIVRAGGRIAVSGHNGPAILTHVEMWLLWKGGVPAEEVIRAATRTGIEKVGYIDDLGSIEPGKIADLVVLSSDPLADILNTLDVRYTIVDGVAYDANTGKEVWPSPGR